ncbi:hypothetical protein ACWCQN_37075 [Streptomyces sp. NPDC001984]
MDAEHLETARRMNSIMERWAQTCRHELLNRTLIRNQAHLLQALGQFESTYHQHRLHRTLHSAAPMRPLPEPDRLDVHRGDRLGGILHEYVHYCVRAGQAADARVEEIRARPRKGSLAAIRDGALLKCVYAIGLRCGEARGPDVADWRHNPKAARVGRFGAVLVRFGKASGGGPSRRRKVLTVPEMDWVVGVLEQYVDEIRPAFAPAGHRRCGLPSGTSTRRLRRRAGRRGCLRV